MSNPWRPDDQPKDWARKILGLLSSLDISSNPLAVLPDSKTGSLVNRSGFINLANAAQTIVASNPARRYIIFQNLSTEDMFIRFGANAAIASNSLRVRPGETFQWSNFVPSDSFTCIAESSGLNFYCGEA